MSRTRLLDALNQLAVRAHSAAQRAALNDLGPADQEAINNLLRDAREDLREAQGALADLVFGDGGRLELLKLRDDLGE